MAALGLSLLKGTLGILVPFLVWVTVERAWRRVFGVSDEERNTTEGCGTCSCTRRCHRRDSADSHGRPVRRSDARLREG